MADPFLGEIRMFGGNFAPLGWALCEGQLLPISQNTALFSLLGTTFGGNGTTTFGLPDLRGRVPISFGQGPGLSAYVMGAMGGSENVTILATQMPAHNHQVSAVTGAQGTSSHPNGQYMASSGSAVIYNNGSPDSTMNQGMIQATGGNQPHSNIQPYLCVNFIIALQGIYPSRN
jgi:microcystin-dependent protein